MEIVGSANYNHCKEDCPAVLGMALRKKYDKIPDLGVMVADDVLMKKLKSGLKKHKCSLKEIYESHTKFLNEEKVTRILKYLLENKKDGFMVLQHNNPIDTRHLVGFLYNNKHNTLDFFDSYNSDRFLNTMRMTNVSRFINDMFHKYFKDEFRVEYIYEINQS